MFDASESVDNGGFSVAGVLGVGGENSPLLQMLLGQPIVPGSQPGYQLCKTMYSYHPLGAVLAEAPSKRAQAKDRIVSVPVPGEENIVRQYWDTWRQIGGYSGTTTIGATQIIHNLQTLSRVYGIASLGLGQKGIDPSTPLDLTSKADLYFNVFDPLNTAGSLVLDQDPNSPDYMKPKQIVVAGQAWNVSRTPIKINEAPFYIDWTSSAFGFSGRSVYQRALYPMKSFVQSMLTDQMVIQKAGLLVAKMKSPGSFVDDIMLKFAGIKRQKLKDGLTGMVFSMGVEESIESLNFQNLEKPFQLARTNVIKNIATAASMPASIIAQETLTEGFGEGSEDAKKEVAYLNDVRRELDPVYAWMDNIVQRRAWDEGFFESQKNLFPDYYGSMKYADALYLWMSKFDATWPNLMEEPESEKAKNADVQLKSAVAVYEVLAPDLDPANKAALITWLSEQTNARKELFASQLDINPDTLEDHLEAKEQQAQEMAESAAAGDDAEPGKPKPFAAAA